MLVNWAYSHGVWVLIQGNWVILLISLFISRCFRLFEDFVDLGQLVSVVIFYVGVQLGVEGSHELCPIFALWIGVLYPPVYDILNVKSSMLWTFLTLHGLYLVSFYLNSRAYF